MSLEHVVQVVRFSAHCVVLLIVCKPALATIEITGNAFPTNVNVAGNFNAVPPGVVVGINANPPGTGSMIINGGSILTSSFATVGELSNLLATCRFRPARGTLPEHSTSGLPGQAQ